VADGVGRYSEFRSASFGGWHPTRRELLIATRFGDTNQVHYLKAPGGDRRQLTFYPDIALPMGFQPTGGESLVFVKDRGGDEFFQYHRYDLGTGEVTLLTDGKSRNTSLTWSNRGTRAAYMSNRRNGRDTDLWMLDSADPKADHMVAELSGGGWSPADWSPDDASLLVIEYISANDSNVYLFDAKSGAKTLLTPKPEGAEVSYGDAQFTQDGKGVYVTTDKDYEFRAEARRRGGVLRRRAVRAGRQGRVRHHRQGLRVPPPRLHRPGDEGDDLPHHRPRARRRRGGALRGRQGDGLRR
jgi:Tol biopolymer transport system component